jgi:subtilisin family serine protease
MSDLYNFEIHLNDYNSGSFLAEELRLENSSYSETVPTRSVSILEKSKRLSAAITLEEATLLLNDNRVSNITLSDPVGNNVRIIFTTKIQRGDFKRNFSTEPNLNNWGLSRVNSKENESFNYYKYDYDGSNVDVVIVDSGIQADHPEFQDENGNSRVVRYNWTSGSIFNNEGPYGIDNWYNPFFGESEPYDFHYTDFHGHGTHVAAILAGKTYGWAKNANIYSLKLSELTTDADAPNGISGVNRATLVLQHFINTKPTNSMGYKNPTIINMSFSTVFGYDFDSPVEYFGYRRTAVTESFDLSNKTLRQETYGIYGAPSSSFNSHLLTVPFPFNTGDWGVNLDIQDIIESGAHVFIAAGNNSLKMATSGNVDYDNFLSGSVFDFTGPTQFSGDGILYYNRPGTPYAKEAFFVGSIDSELSLNGKERKSYFSANGPAVDIYAPGHNIISAISNTNVYNSEEVPYSNPSFKAANLSGTSMASPQVAGLAALYLQREPFLTPAELKQKMINDAKTGKLDILDSQIYGQYATASIGEDGNDKYLFSGINQEQKFNINLS